MMSEAIKKPRKPPESYNPKKPELANLMKNAEAENPELHKTNIEGITDTPTKNSLDINASYNYLETCNFIQRFATAYIYLEAANNPKEIFYDPDVGGHCFGCGSGGEKHSCKKDKFAAKRCMFFFLFNTVCGNSSVRRRFNGEPTEMQKLIGDTPEEGHGCGSDFTVDFLFGYTGYDYRICTDESAFKDEIVAAINAGKPVIARGKSGDANFPILIPGKPGNPRFRLITGYDGDNLTIPHFVGYDFSTNPPTEKTEEPPTYDELEVLYIFGNKTARRYTLKNGLNNIRRVMEYNINAGLWDEYLVKLGGSDKFPSDDGLVKAGSNERIARAKHLYATNMYMYNFCSFGGALDLNGKLPNHYLHRELFTPALSKLWGTINNTHWAIVKAGHATGKLGMKKIWLINDPAKIAEISTEVCNAIAKAKAADVKLLKMIKQAIEVVDSTAIA